MAIPLRVAAMAAEAIVIIDDRPSEVARDRDRALADTPFVSILHPDDHPAASSVADALATTVGAHGTSLGGLGAYQSISLRGASPGHTLIAIDGVPLARIAAVTTDLGRFALAAFDRVDVYRGSVPIALGGAGVGGAVDLVTRLGRDELGKRVHLELGGGSAGARFFHAHYGDVHRGGALRSSTTLGYAGATGAYTFFDNHGTPLNLTDDATRTRANNGFDQADLASRLGAADGSLAGGVRLAYKRQGLPGSTLRPTAAARLATLDTIADLRIARATVDATIYALVEHQRLADPGDELGLGAQHRGYLTLAGGASATSTQVLDRAGHQRLVVGGELRVERFADEDLADATHATEGDRVAAAALASLELELAPQLVVTPAVRVDGLRTAPAATTVGPDAYVARPTRDDVVPSPRLGVRALLAPDLAIKSSAG
ncbi:MAG: TonB-dependent receptor plug domain-containing protein, partial [Proteobacteria bacterium]|nr:TonB-dependent receptor plug domain-containing protein [Pseudomonadota bacterium]